MASKSRSSRASKNFEPEEKPGLSADTKRGIVIVLLAALAIITLLALFSLAGQASDFVNEIVGAVFGWGRFLFPWILLTLAITLWRRRDYSDEVEDEEELSHKPPRWKRVHSIGFGLLFLTCHAFLHAYFSLVDMQDKATAAMGGGWLGFALAYPLVRYFGPIATTVILLTISVVGLLLFFETSLRRMFLPVTSLAAKHQQQRYAKAMAERESAETVEEVAVEEVEEEVEPEPEEEEIEEEEEVVEEDVVEPVTPQFLVKPVTEHQPGLPLLSMRRRRIDIPLKFLDDNRTKPNAGNVELNKQIIQKTLEDFGIKADMGEINTGPTVTQFTLKPAEGVRLNRISVLNDNLALALAAHPIRIEAPIPGRSLVGIEVPNHSKAAVGLRELLISKDYKSRTTNMFMALGKDVRGKSWFADLTKLPHLLIAGSTGSGKSVCINTIITSLLFQNGPDDVKLILVDPKRVELTLYNDIPHLLCPVITDVKKTVNALNWCLAEMDKRYEMLAKMGKRNIAGYNQEAEHKMPYIIFVIDELADLMVVSANEIETSVIRIAQMARAVGIHLILATQRPSVDVITGLIKANVPGRIAFSVASIVDSRTILDSAGAEKLLGRGDMLFVSPDQSKPKRIQGVFISDEETKRITDYLKSKAKPEYHADIVKVQGAGTTGGFGMPDEDDMLPAARKLILESGKASASLFQRHLKVGYARAARLLDLLEEQGVVGPADGAKPRDVYVDRLRMLMAGGAAMPSSPHNNEQQAIDEEFGYANDQPDVIIDEEDVVEVEEAADDDPSADDNQNSNDAGDQEDEVDDVVEDGVEDQDDVVDDTEDEMNEEVVDDDSTQSDEDQTVSDVEDDGEAVVSSKKSTPQSPSSRGPVRPGDDW